MSPNNNNNGYAVDQEFGLAASFGQIEKSPGRFKPSSRKYSKSVYIWNLPVNHIDLKIVLIEFNFFSVHQLL